MPVSRSACLTAFPATLYDVRIVPIIHSSRRNLRWRRELRLEANVGPRGHHAVSVCAALRAQCAFIRRRPERFARESECMMELSARGTRGDQVRLKPLRFCTCTMALNPLWSRVTHLSMSRRARHLDPIETQIPDSVS